MRARLGERGGSAGTVVPDGVFEQVLEALSIDYPRHRGGWQKMLCVFHDESVPSMTIDIDRGAFKCHSCGTTGGDVFAFLMKLEEISFPQAKKRVEELTGIAQGSSFQPKQERVNSGGFRPRFQL